MKPLLITIRNKHILTIFGWWDSPTYVTASWKLWLRWLWAGHDWQYRLTKLEQLRKDNARVRHF